MNPETRLVWHPLRDQFDKLKKERLLAKESPPHYERLETVAGDTPDLSWAFMGKEGHIELKYRADWPVRPLTPVVISSITAGQRLWWRQRSAAGGNIHVLTRIGMEWFLFEGAFAAFHLGKVNRFLLYGSNLLTDPRRLDLMEVLQL